MPSTVSAKALCFRAAFVRLFVRPDRSCYHHIS